MRAMALALAVLMPGAALAGSPYAGFMVVVDTCFHGADDAPMARACIGLGSDACIDGAPDGGTTVGTMFCLMAERDAWDVMLNDEYRRARAAAGRVDAQESPQYAVRADQVQAAQRAWIAFRDANCTMQYGIYGAGSLRQIVGADCQMRMTADRTVDLRSYRLALGDE